MSQSLDCILAQYRMCCLETGFIHLTKGSVAMLLSYRYGMFWNAVVFQCVIPFTVNSVIFLYSELILQFAIHLFKQLLKSSKDHPLFISTPLYFLNVAEHLQLPSFSYTGFHKAIKHLLVLKEKVPSPQTHNTLKTSSARSPATNTHTHTHTL